MIITLSPLYSSFNSHPYLQATHYKGLVTNYGEGGGLQNGRGGGAREVLPLRKGGTEKALAILKGGGGGAQQVLG